MLASAALFGLLTALVFSLKPLGSALRVSPTVLFRGYDLSGAEPPGRRVQLAIALAALALAILAVATASDRRLALWFIGGVMVCFALFHLLARGVIHQAARLSRPSQPSLRLGLGNIHRRGAPAASAIFSLGLGLTAPVINTQVQSNLRDAQQYDPGVGAATYKTDPSRHGAVAAGLIGGTDRKLFPPSGIHRMARLVIQATAPPSGSRDVAVIYQDGYEGIGAPLDGGGPTRIRF